MRSSTLFIWWIPLPGNGIRAGPLDSLSQDCKTQRYFVEKRTEAEKVAAQEEILEKDRSKLLAFLVETLELERE